MNIVLIGYRGTGKSTIAKLLSKRLHRRLFVIDAMIARSAEMPIPSIVEDFGWSRFREIESIQIQGIANLQKNAVIDCGGGAILEPSNVEALKRRGRMALLTADYETIIKRIRRDPNRPPLKDGLTFEEEQRQVLEERDPMYRAVADLVCDTSETAPEETVSNIIRFFRNHRWI